VNSESAQKQTENRPPNPKHVACSGKERKTLPSRFTCQSKLKILAPHPLIVTVLIRLAERADLFVTAPEGRIGSSIQGRQRSQSGHLANAIL
jgi:hypothetical protein